jgi:hypothetical protein
MSRVQYKIRKLGTSYVVTRVERDVDASGRHTGSMRTLARYETAARAEQQRRSLQLREQASNQDAPPVAAA